MHSVRYTIVFAVVLSSVCALLVSTVAVALRERQNENMRLHRQRHVLLVTGLMQPGEALSREEILERFAANIETRVVDLASGAYVDAIDPLTFDARRAAREVATSRAAPENTAGVRRVPIPALVYLKLRDGRVEALVLPVEGTGLWSRLFGYLALAGDTRTVLGITFYEHAETPGLGAEVDNPRWKAKWKGRLAFDDGWTPRLEVIKGRAGPPTEDPHRVDGISGATLTGDSVTQLLRFWLSERGFGPFLEAHRARRGSR